MKKLSALMLALGMTVSLAACGGSTDSADTTASESETTEESTDAAETEETADAAEASGDGSYVIGICQLVQHEALDAATQGFKDAVTEALGAENVTFDEQNASNDSATCATIINQFVSNNVDLILANATAPLQAAAQGTDTIPVLGTSVTEYGVALDIDNFDGLVGTNVSGTSDLAPLDQQAAMLQELFPDAETVGLLYCSAEANSQYQVDTVQDIWRKWAIPAPSILSLTPTIWRQ